MTLASTTAAPSVNPVSVAPTLPNNSVVDQDGRGSAILSATALSPTSLGTDLGAERPSEPACTVDRPAKPCTASADFSRVCMSDRAEVDVVQLQELLAAAAFWARDRRAEDLAIALSHSNPVVSAWDGDRLVGFARANSDGIYRATIWDVVVHPDYQGAGIGRKLVQTVLAHPLLCRVERVYLMTTNQQAFYERIGFEVNLSTTMVLFDRGEIVPLPAGGLAAQSS